MAEKYVKVVKDMYKPGRSGDRVREVEICTGEKGIENEQDQD